RKVVGVIGPATSATSNDAQPIFEEYGVPTITPSATSPDLATKGWRHWHRLIASDDEQVAQLADYLDRVYPISRAYTIDYGDAAKAFVQRYQQRFGSAPGMFALEGYDAATAFLDAIRAGKTTPADVNQYLSTVQFTGLSRPVHFGPNGENTARPLYLYKVKNS